jgi:uncharacterized surface protein with fasciclin (FAS1) repeats
MFCSGKKDSEAGSQGVSTEVKHAGGQASVVDDVSQRNIVQIAAGSPDHTTLVAAVQAAGLADVLANPGPLTVFAPNNAAFEKLPEGTVDNLLKPENKKTLVNIITYHAAPSTYYTKDLENGMSLYMATGDYVDISVKDGKYYANGNKILGSVDAANGVVHVVDGVLLPPEK